MAEEKIVIPLSVPDSFFDEMDRRFEAMARRASQQFSQAMRGGGASAGGGNPGGAAFGGQGTAAASALGNAIGGIFGSAGSAVAATPAAAAFSGPVVAQNAVMGAAQGGLNAVSSLAKVGGSAVGGAIGTALGGPVGGILGAGIGGQVGESLTSLIQAQFNSVKEAMEIPTERGVARLKGLYGNLAAAGIETSASDRDAAIAFQQAIERKRYEGERQIEKQYREFAARDSMSYGLNFVGR